MTRAVCSSFGFRKSDMVGGRETGEGAMTHSVDMFWMQSSIAAETLVGRAMRAVGAFGVPTFARMESTTAEVIVRLPG